MVGANDSARAEEAGESRETSNRRGWWYSVIGPPFEALLRVWRALTDSQRGILGRLLRFWQYLFRGPESDPADVSKLPTKAAALLSSAILALTMYAWPLSDILPIWLFFALTAIVFFVAYRGIQFASVSGSGHRWEA